MLADFETNGARLIAVSPQLDRYNDTIKKQSKLEFDIVSDKENRLADRWGLKTALPEALQKIYADFKIDLPRYNGDDTWTLPLPARVIVDTDMKIRYFETDPDYTVRPEPAHTLDALKKI